MRSRTKSILTLNNDVYALYTEHSFKIGFYDSNEKLYVDERTMILSS